MAGIMALWHLGFTTMVLGFWFLVFGLWLWFMVMVYGYGLWLWVWFEVMGFLRSVIEKLIYEAVNIMTSKNSTRVGEVWIKKYDKS